MSDIFSEEARRALDHARRFASRFGHDAIAAGHLLLGLFQPDVGMALRAAARSGDGLRIALRVMENAVQGSIPGQTETDPVFSPSVLRAVEAAGEEAGSQRRSLILPEHLLLGLLESKGEEASRLLEKARIDPEATAHCARAAIAAAPTGPSPHADQNPPGWDQPCPTFHLMEVILRASNEAKARRQDYFGPPHLFLALLQGGTVSEVLGRHGIDPKGLENALTRFLATAPPTLDCANPRPGKETMATLAEANAEAFAADVDSTDSLHLLLALLRSHDDGIGRALQAAEVEPAALYEKLLGLQGAEKELHDIRLLIQEMNRAMDASGLEKMGTPPFDNTPDCLKPIAGMTAPNMTLFLDPVHRVLAAARVIARRRGKPRPGSGDLLLAFFREGGDFGQQIFRKLGLDPDLLLERLCAFPFFPFPGHAEGPSGLSLEAVAVLRKTLSEAHSLGKAFGGVEHVLLAILSDPLSEAGFALQTLEVKPGAAREAILKMIAENEQ